MSHFSKIKTNISNLSILKQTVRQLGFYYEVVRPIDVKSINLPIPMNLMIYNSLLDTKPLFSFVWNICEYNLVADLQLWSLDTDVNYFVDKLSQKYACNVILSRSLAGGFQKVSEKTSVDGSVKITVQRWSY